MIKTRKIDLSKISSLKIGGKVKAYEISNISDLHEIAKIAQKNNQKVHVLGEGTNSYFVDSFKSKIFLILNFKKQIKFKNNLVMASASANWNTLVKKTISKDLWGLENLISIPGSVGAAPVQNIGAYGTEIKNTFISAKVFDLRKSTIVEMQNSDCEFSNRDSIFKKFPNRYIILEITLKLSTQPNPILTYSPLNTLPKNVTQKEIAKLVTKTRNEKLPNYKKFPNCGSFFKNIIISPKELERLQVKYPDIKYFGENEIKISSAWILDKILDIKNIKYKNIGSWKKHSLVLVNYSKGKKVKATELNTFVSKIKAKVKKLTGLSLEQEVNFVN